MHKIIGLFSTSAGQFLLDVCGDLLQLGDRLLNGLWQFVLMVMIVIMVIRFRSSLLRGWLLHCDCWRDRRGCLRRRCRLLTATATESQQARQRHAYHQKRAQVFG